MGAGACGDVPERTLCVWQSKHGSQRAGVDRNCAIQECLLRNNTLSQQVSYTSARIGGRSTANWTSRKIGSMAGSSEDGAAQGGVHAQALVPLHAGRMGFCQKNSKLR